MKKLFLISPVLILAFAGIFFWQEIYSPKNAGAPKEIFFSAEKGESLNKIASTLEEEGLIKNALLFQGYVLLAGENDNLQAGVYLISSAMNIPEIVQKFAAG